MRMRPALLLFAVLAAAVAAASAGQEHRVRGLVVDESGGVLPGVTVTAAAPDGRDVATTVTDGAGRYVLGPVAGGRLIVSFRLDGFAPAAVPVAIGEGDAVANQRLVVAPRSETVDVVGRIPVAPPPPPAPAPPRPRPRPVMWAVPEHDRQAVCGPALLESPPQSLGSVRARRYAANGLYGAGDELAIDGGLATGLSLGDSFVVRRSFHAVWDGRERTGEHTAGLVQIVAADERTAVAVVIYACDDMRPGDRLETFHPHPIPTLQPEGKPEYRHPAKILFPDEGQLIGAPRRLLVIDRGAAAGVLAGQRVTLFRRRADGGDPTIVGEGVVVAVRNLSATIRVDRASDAVFEGDQAAIQR